MAYEIPGFSFTLPASTGVINNQFIAVTLNASGQAALPATVNDAVVGVMTNKPTAEGQAATIVNDGIVKVKAAGGTLGLGDVANITTDGFVDDSTGTALGEVVNGSSGSTGRILSVLLG